MTRAKDMSDFGPSASAGAVLQVVQDFESTNNVLSTTYTNLYEKSITLKSTSSDVYGFFYFQHSLATAGGYGVKVFRNTSASVTTSHTAVWSAGPVQNSTGPYTWYAYETNGTYGVGTINPKDTLSGFSVGNTLYYGLFFRKRDSNVVAIGTNDDTDGFISSTLMEVVK